MSRDLKRAMPNERAIKILVQLKLFPFVAIGQIGVRFLWFVSYVAQIDPNYNIKPKTENKIITGV